MEWNNSRVLVTGATGFLGSWLCKELVRKGAFVVAFIRDDLPMGPLKEEDLYCKLGAVVYGDITKYENVKRAFDEYEIDTCFHLAAQTIVGTANSSPVGTFETNIKGSWNILESARNSPKLRRLIIASTDKVYGEPVELPIKEDHPLLASYPYDASKACVEILARTYFKTYGVPLAITRCCNIYGGGDLNFSRIIPDSVRSVILGKNPVIRSDGTPVRDFVYVKDAVDAYIALAENLGKPGVNGEAFNFGSNAPISMLDLVKKIITVSGNKNLKPDVQGKAKPKAEIDRQYLSSIKAEKVLGWKPKYKLEDGLKETARWYKEYLPK
jgi:CDP-glucose 4,6-dehydratase